ncbi:(d)CMP kinase [bacterium]|nr:(d)CMP kinase [bacterium]
MDKIIIAIDGPAGAGKSEIAKRVARGLKYEYIDTGAMYRAIAWKLLKSKINIEDDEELQQLIDNTEISWQSQENVFRVFVDGGEVTDEIRTQSITKKTNEISMIQKVREYLLILQRKAGVEKGIIMEGRDIGTAVFPQAEKKFYLDATLEERAKRRYRDLKKQDQTVKMEKIKEAIRFRDEKDKNRSLNPLKAARDAILIDTTNLSLEEVVQCILDKLKK